MYNILEKVFFGDTLVLKFRNIQFWNDLIIGGVKYMYEQDYIIRMNNEVITKQGYRCTCKYFRGNN